MRRYCAPHPRVRLPGLSLPACPAPTRVAVLTLTALLLAVLRLGAQQTDAATDPLPTVLYLVRHAETAPDGTRDPPLSREGERRARWLGVILSHARLDAVYTTDYRRTRSTAGPAAAAHGVQITVYDPSDLEGLAHELRVRAGRVLVVGHSNTTPALVEALGGEPGDPMEESEHDRLYVLVIAGDSVRTAVLRY